MNVDGTQIKVVDADPFYDQIAEEIELYNLDAIKFRKGDYVLDIGAHVGLVSIYLAKRHPGIIIHSYEPVVENFIRLKRHVRLNRTPNVFPHKLAVTADGLKRIMVHGEHHSGGATAFHEFERKPFEVTSTTVPRILKRHGIKRIKLLKLDCEGAEHEILESGVDTWLPKVKHIRGEIHKVKTSLDAQKAAIAAGVPDIQWTFAY